MHYDHTPLLVNLHPSYEVNNQRPFCFLAAWTTHPFFSQFFKDHWRYGSDLNSSLQKLSSALLDWNKSIFWDIFQRKKRLWARIAGVQKSLDEQVTKQFLKLEAKLKKELDLVLFQEELLWFQKSREDWIHFGDRNTRFFHTSTIVKHSCNHIKSLKDSSGDWIMDELVLKGMAHQFFSELFSVDFTSGSTFLSRGNFPSFPATAVDALNRPFLLMKFTQP